MLLICAPLLSLLLVISETITSCHHEILRPHEKIDSKITIAATEKHLIFIRFATGNFTKSLASSGLLKIFPICMI